MWRYTVFDISHTVEQTNTVRGRGDAMMTAEPGLSMMEAT
jgi:hypothetical protein